MNFPNDDTGNVLNEMYAAGIDLTTTHAIVFFQLFEQEQQARAMAQHLEEKCPQMIFSIHADPETANVWDLDCTVTMLPSYDGIIAQEAEFELLAAKFNGYNDGWGIAID
ncbi:MAG: ribonuclease E inhibitor RraB [Alteromonadaceae bacterium]|nr:ribonuclease E inhibitor RraB [Alteromonadaceae bacterium]